MLTYTDIQSYVDAGLSPAEIAAELQSQTIAIENPTAWTIGSMQNAIGPELTLAVAQIIKTAGATNPLVDAAWIALSTVGLQLYTADRQTMIEQLGAGTLTAEQVQVVKELGVKQEPKFPGVSEQDVLSCIKQKAIDQCRADMAAILQPVQAKSSAVNAWLDVLDTSGMTQAEVQAYCDALLASSDGNPQ